MASSLLCTKEYVSDSVKSKKKIKHHWTVLLSAMLRTKTATKKWWLLGHISWETGALFLICASRKGTVLKGEDTWQPGLDNTAFVLMKKKGSLWADLAQLPLTVPVTRCALQTPQLSASCSSLFISSSKLTLQGLFCSLRTELYCLTKQVSTFFPSWNTQRPKITGRHNDDNHLPYYQMYFHTGPCLQAEVLN